MDIDSILRRYAGIETPSQRPTDSSTGSMQCGRNMADVGPNERPWTDLFDAVFGKDGPKTPAMMDLFGTVRQKLVEDPKNHTAKQQEKERNGSKIEALEHNPTPHSSASQRMDPNKKSPNPKPKKYRRWKPKEDGHKSKESRFKPWQ